MDTHTLCIVYLILSRIDQVFLANQPQWLLVDNFEFDNYANNEQFHNDPNWIIDDEPGNLCTGENFYQHCCHRMQNVQIHDGKLEIVANLNERYASSRFLFNTGQLYSNQSWFYGKFVMKAMLPKGKWLRSVFLLKPKKPKYFGDWIRNGQINGLVYTQQSDIIKAGIHYHMSKRQTYRGKMMATKQNLTNEFHLYSVEWTKSSVRWYFDDQMYFEEWVSKPFDQPMYFALQLGVGGPEFDTRNNVVSTSDAKEWPSPRFVIDYIKVYQDAVLLGPNYQRVKSDGKAVYASTTLYLTVCLIVFCLINGY